jgi:hypothetical protein
MLPAEMLPSPLFYPDNRRFTNKSTIASAARALASRRRVSWMEAKVCTS